MTRPEGVIVDERETGKTVPLDKERDLAPEDSFGTRGIGRPNLELTTDYARPTQEHWFTLHMRVELDDDEFKTIQTDMEKADRKDLKRDLKQIVKDKYGNHGGLELIDGIPDTLLLSVPRKRN